MSKSLVLGATGAFGGAVLRALVQQGQDVRVLLRSPEKLKVSGVEVVKGDASNLSSVIDAAKDCTAIYHGLNVPYTAWNPEIMRLNDNVVEASGLSGATLVYPGSLLGVRPITDVPQPPQIWDPMPLDFISPLGLLQEHMEAQFLQNNELRNVRTIILRSGFWFGPGVRNPLAAAMVDGALKNGRVPWLKDPTEMHLFSFVDDIAQLAIALVGLEAEGNGFEVWNAPGHIIDGKGWAEAWSQATGKTVQLWRYREWELRLLNMFSATHADYLARCAAWGGIILDDRRTLQRVPSAAPTPLVDALKQTLKAWKSE